MGGQPPAVRLKTVPLVSCQRLAPPDTLAVIKRNVSFPCRLRSLMAEVTLTWVERGDRTTRTFDLFAADNRQRGTIRLGRDPEQCDLLLGGDRVSRLHAEIFFEVASSRFYLRNLREVNPILVDGHPLGAGKALLRRGTTLVLGERHLEVTHLGLHRVAAKAPQRQVANGAPKPIPEASPLPFPEDDFVPLSQYMPLAFAGPDFRQQAFLVPGIATVIWVILLFASIGRPALFNFWMAVYLGGVGYFFIYKMCNKPKPFWVLAIPAVATPILIVSPVWFIVAVFFRDVLPGGIDPQNKQFLELFVMYFFGAGLAEELLKALPVLGMEWLSRGFQPRIRKKMLVREPLDGILLGASSGLGFTIVETMMQYVPEFVRSVSGDLGEATGELVGLQLLIPRIVGSVFGHMAYSGCLGYYIGLSALKPRKRWEILLAGYLLSSGVHALWNASIALGIWALAGAGILGYCLLMATILKARQLSSHRGPSPARHDR